MSEIKKHIVVVVAEKLCDFAKSLAPINRTNDSVGSCISRLSVLEKEMVKANRKGKDVAPVINRMEAPLRGLANDCQAMSEHLKRCADIATDAANEISQAKTRL